MENGYLPFPKGFSTILINSDPEPEQSDSLSVVPPIVTSSIFKQYFPINSTKYIYGSCGNPSRNILEDCLAALENARYGLCFSSGLAAANVVFSMFKSGDHIILDDSTYAGIVSLFSNLAESMGILLSFIDTSDITEMENEIKRNTKMIWIETPTNPMLKIINISMIAKSAYRHKILLAVDNTFLTPYLQRPLDMGADIVIHSLSKYINGHFDVIMGAVLINNEDIYAKLAVLQRGMGMVPSPFDCSQVTRSLKTLSIRMEKHSANGLIIAKFLETQAKVIQVLHPGLQSHPQHELFKKQTSGHSGIISFYIQGAFEESQTFLNQLKMFTLADSFGGYKSLAELPSRMTHSSLPAEVAARLKISDNLIRISVGLEDVEDLIADLRQALDCI